MGKNGGVPLFNFNSELHRTHGTVIDNMFSCYTKLVTPCKYTECSSLFHLPRVIVGCCVAFTEERKLTGLFHLPRDKTSQQVKLMLNECSM